MSQNQQIPNEIRGFLEGLISDSGMVIEDNMREEMIKELYARLDSYMTSVIVDHLPEENIEAFIKMNGEKKSKEEIESYLKDKIPNVKEIFTNSFIDFRNLYLGNVAAQINSNG